MFAYQSMSFWYASLLRERALAPLRYLVGVERGRHRRRRDWDGPVTPAWAIAAR
jgi:hypothetical protein